MAGSSRKGENVMPVELAIQRELEYRRKVAAFHLCRNTNSIEKVQSSNKASHPMPLTGPSSRLFSSPSLSGTKWMKSPTSSVHCPLMQDQQSLHDRLVHKAKTDDLYCKICQISCTSPFNLKQHLMGYKHRENLQEGRNYQKQWCELCKVSCMNEDLLKLHLQGQKHKAKMEELEIIKHGGEAPNKQKWCELCKLRCIDEFSFKQHLVGKKHINRLHSMEKEKVDHVMEW